MKAITYDHERFKKALAVFTILLGGWCFFIALQVPASSLQKTIAVVSVAMFVVFLCATIVVGFLDMRRERLEAEFMSCFSFGLPADPGQRIILQRRVNGQLKKLAGEFQEHCAREAKFLEDVASTGVASYEETEAALAKLTGIRMDLKVMKRLFWDAHGAAKRARFEVFRKHTEYLDLR